MLGESGSSSLAFWAWARASSIRPSSASDRLNQWRAVAYPGLSWIARRCSADPSAQFQEKEETVALARGGSASWSSSSSAFLAAEVSLGTASLAGIGMYQTPRL